MYSEERRSLSDVTYTLKKSLDGSTADNSDPYELVSDSSRGAGGNYTVSCAALKRTGVCVCGVERGKPAYYTTISNTQPLWVTGEFKLNHRTSVSPPVSLIIGPSRAQHFRLVSLSLSCEDQSNSTGWRVTRYTDRWGLEDCSSSVSGSQTGSTCIISSTIPEDTGVYWCQSESGEKYHPVNVTIHFGLILESPVHPVTEGDTLTLRCLYQHTTPPNPRADFYKDGLLIQSQTTEMIISTVSKSHEGVYYCKHPERGESPKSWISVRVSHSESRISVLHTLSSVLAVSPYLLVTVLLIFKYCRMKGVEVSGLCAGQSSSSTPDSVIHVFMDLALCAGAQSCWKRKGPAPNRSHKVGSMELSKMSWFAEAYPFTGQAQLLKNNPTP
ncbi:Fc receptor-like protein 5 [Garra rufa]|uniref:Fc receptor-like protein 5 n=1 Tax=Garra rufa TaxID=137080 RepID=UPI003CCEEC01